MQNQNADDDVDGNNKKIFHFVLLISLENAYIPALEIKMFEKN